MSIVMGAWGFSPRDFWTMTMFEFWAIHEAKNAGQEEPFSRDDLEEMMEKFPDGIRGTASTN